MTEQEMKIMAHNAVERVSKVLGDVSTAEIMSKDRHFRVATARQLVFWYLYNVCKMGWSDIGRAMGKHHATAMYGEQQASIMIERNRTKEDRRIYNAAMELKGENTKRLEDKIVEALNRGNGEFEFGDIEGTATADGDNLEVECWDMNTGEHIDVDREYIMMRI